MKKIKKNKILKITLLIIVIALAVGAKEGYRLYQYKKKAAATVVHTPDFNKITDGEFVGEYDLDYVNVMLTVQIKNKKIDEITINRHKNERGAVAEVTIPDRVIKNQSLDVDMVSGATNSSKAILKSVEMALGKSIRNI